MSFTDTRKIARRKRVPAYVPQYTIRQIVAKYHVGTPDATIEADIRKRAANNAGFTPEKVQACVDFAIVCHRENQDLYHAVMTGRF